MTRTIQWLRVPQAIALAAWSWASFASAQIAPDTSLPVDSIIAPNGRTVIIEGGTAAGNNLFHSFSEFSVPDGTEAVFNNAIEIDNIVTRVTGNNISRLDGTIQTNGSANLIFMNPNGIVFGENARLDLGGSLMATTAERIQFSDGIEFSTTMAASEASPLLSVSVPVGLQFGATPGNISSRSSNLQLETGQTFGAIASGIEIDGGTIGIPRGRIELGSVGGGARIRIDDGFTLHYEEVIPFQNIRLSNGAIVTTRSDGGGDIQVRGDRIDLLAGSSIVADTEGNLDAGNIDIVGRSLWVDGGSRVSAASQAGGQGGNLNITTTELVEVSGARDLDRDSVQFSTIAATSRGEGNSGNILIETYRFVARDGADVSVTAFGNGTSGNLVLNSTGSVNLNGAGVSADGTIFSRSGLFAATEGIQAGGSLTINTPVLSVTDGARVSVSTRGPGREGFLGGRGGNLIVNAADTIVLSGVFVAPDGRMFESGLFALSGEVRPTISADAATGNGGDLTVTTSQLNISNGAIVSVAARGAGAAGNLTIAADRIRLNNGFITGVTAQGQGSNLSLQVSDFIELRRGSRISTTAGGSGNGGDISIDAGAIALIGNSAIAANAFAGNGGGIEIITDGLFVFDRDRQITASSSLGVSGNISVSTPDVNNTAGLFALSNDAIDASSFGFADCRNYLDSEFYYTGRGGIPENPRQFLELQMTVDDLGELEPLPSDREGDRNLIPHTSYLIPLTEATTWTIAPDGQISLVSQQPTIATLPQPRCHATRLVPLAPIALKRRFKIC